MKPEDLLPAPITSITPQKNNKKRYSIFVDETFLIGIADTTLLKRKLKVHSIITPALFKKLQRDEGYNQIKNYILKLISRREHGRKELFRKAQQKDYSPDIIEHVLSELEKKDFINDTRFANKFANDKGTLSNWGPSKITAHLRKKGVDKKISQEAVKQVYEEIDLEAQLSGLVLKRKRHFLREKDALKRKKKVINYLLQKGYQPENIYRYIDTLMNMLDS